MSPSKILESLQRCGDLARQEGVTLEWRTTVADPLISLEDLWVIGSAMQPGDTWSLQQYRPHGDTKKSEAPSSGLRPFSPSSLEYIRDDFNQLAITIR